MAVKTWGQREFIGDNWTFTSDSNGNWTHEQIQTAATMQLVREVQQLNATMQSIRSLMLQLGGDGIHEVVREQARTARIAAQRRKARAKKARAKLRAA
jgi:hypothetical protein